MGILVLGPIVLCSKERPMGGWGAVVGPFSVAPAKLHAGTPPWWREPHECALGLQGGPVDDLIKLRLGNGGAARLA